MWFLCVMVDCILRVYQALFILPILLFVSWYYKRHKWMVLKSRKIIFKPRQH